MQEKNDVDAQGNMSTYYSYYAYIATHQYYH